MEGGRRHGGRVSRGGQFGGHRVCRSTAAPFPQEPVQNAALAHQRGRAPSLVAKGTDVHGARVDCRSVPLLPAGIAALRERTVGPSVVFMEAAEAAALQLRGHLMGRVRW